MRMKILLVDDHEIVRLGLKSLLSRYPSFEVVGEAGTAREAVDKVRQYKPDVVVMDIRMPGSSGIEATREIMQKQPATKVIMLTSYVEDEMLFEAISAGAVGYVLKQIGSGDLVRALEAVSRGESLIDPALMRKVISKLREASRKAEDEAFGTLTEQELKVLALVAEGKTNKEIASAIFLSEKTVRNYVSVILSKLNLSTRSEAAAYAVKHHIQDHLTSEP
jgi:two-component system, NarL family, response regulator DevR